MSLNFKNIASIALMIVSLSGCLKKEQPKPEPKILTVGAVALQAQDIPLSFEFTGKAQGSKETEVRARVGGILIKRNYIEGEEVKKGQVLFEIDRKPYLIAMQEAKAQLDRQRADLKADVKQFERLKTLGKKGFSSQRSQDNAEANVLATQASIKAAKSAYEDAKLNYEYSLVEAPIGGLTSMETHSEGSLISISGQNSLLTTITQVNPAYVVFSMADNELFRLGNMIKNGKINNPKGDSEFKALVNLSADEVYEKEGYINFINPTIDSNTGTLKLRAVFENPKRQLVPGQFLRVSLEGLVRINALKLPKEVVQQGAAGSFVFVVNDEGKIETRAVKTGYTSKTGEWIIDEGLEEGDVVAVDNFIKLKKGMPVNVEFIEEEIIDESVVDTDVSTEE